MSIFHCVHSCSLVKDFRGKYIASNYPHICSTVPWVGGLSEYHWNERQEMSNFKVNYVAVFWARGNISEYSVVLVVCDNTVSNWLKWSNNITCCGGHVKCRTRCASNRSRGCNTPALSANLRQKKKAALMYLGRVFQSKWYYTFWCFLGSVLAYLIMEIKLRRKF